MGATCLTAASRAASDSVVALLRARIHSRILSFCKPATPKNEHPPTIPAQRNQFDWLQPALKCQ
eukprot:1668651-Rhodomonas_salina.1